ncbi:MAG: copper chaperone PCu(A)C [Gammaproteobacteria bacterium]|nr:copper chaperone PCu(A)C [Gammaproteobacteria bacterium]TVQ47366.1 MAG: copper chaperone PCu(A)C [Gammaproteobacteria bacterium]
MSAALRAALTAVAALQLVACAPVPEDGVVIEEAWIREAPPGARALAGYMQLRNQGGDPVALLFANSDTFDRIELHQTLHDDGRMRMVEVDHVPLPPGQTVAFAPGGLHLMLFAPSETLRDGEEVMIELTFSDGTARDLRFEVRDVRERR